MTRDVSNHQSMNLADEEPIDVSVVRSAALVRLQSALDDAGFVACAAERGALAIITPRVSDVASDMPALDASMRRWLVQAALGAGFSHVALEIPAPTPSDAALPGGYPA